MPKTADYTRKAIDKYRENNDFINLKFPKGTKERLKELGISNSDLVDECLNFINDIAETLQEDAEESAGCTQVQTAQISPAKEEREEITAKPEKAVNKANKESFDIYAVQAELDARREEVKAHKDSGEEPEEVPEPVEDIPDESGESDELTDRLNAMKAYRKQVVEEREKYGEASDDLIKDFVEKTEKEGEDITSPEYQERIREAIGAINLNRINEYLKSIGKI